MKGLFVMGMSAGLTLYNCLPNVYLNTQLKYNIVEKADNELDGYLSDHQSCLYNIINSVFCTIGPVAGAFLYEKQGITQACDELQVLMYFQIWRSFDFIW